eukprot:1144962-Pelagomonas_calceolata.AAC.10
MAARAQAAEMEEWLPALLQQIILTIACMAACAQAAEMEKRLAAASKAAAAAEEAAAAARAASKDSERRRQGLEKKLVGDGLGGQVELLECVRRRHGAFKQPTWEMGWWRGSCTAPVHENGVRMFTCARHQDRVNPLSRCMLDCKHEPTPDAQHSAPPPCLYLQADSVASCSKASDERDFLRSLNDQLLSNQKQLRLAAEEARGELASRDATIRELQEQVPSALAYSNCSALTLDFGQQFCMGNGRGPLSPWFHF